MIMQEIVTGLVQPPENAPDEETKRQAVFTACNEIHKSVARMITETDLGEYNSYMSELDIMISRLYRFPTNEKRGVLESIVNLGDEIVTKLIAGEIELHFTKFEALETRKNQASYLKEKIDFVRDNINLFPQERIAESDRPVD